jgi:hypothetical protein
MTTLTVFFSAEFFKKVELDLETKLYQPTILIRVAKSKKIKKAKFGHKQFQKGPNPKK